MIPSHISAIRSHVYVSCYIHAPGTPQSCWSSRGTNRFSCIMFSFPFRIYSSVVPRSCMFAILECPPIERRRQTRTPTMKGFSVATARPSQCRPPHPTPPLKPLPPLRKRGLVVVEYGQNVPRAIGAGSHRDGIALRHV